ncbi:MAG: CoA transferase [Acidobacteria bacterium]|nr:CoA transferase [Acidobacteriota bacterium]
MKAPRPLAGIRVLDLGQVYQGPYAGFLLAQAGADVVKVEPPRGEPLRRREAHGGPPSFPLAFLNTNKRSVTCDLKQEEGRELLRRLAGVADVLIENFAPGVLDRLGVGWKMLRKLNPRLIYASGTAYGLSGPDHESLGMDITVQAWSGVMSVNGVVGGDPLKAGPAFIDFLGGTHLYAGVVSALYERERTGTGRLVEVAMQEAVYPTLLSQLGVMHHEGTLPGRSGNRHGRVSPYNVYPCRDGHVALICITERHWRNLLGAMEREDLTADRRFRTNEARVAHRDETDGLVAEWTAALTRAEINEAARFRRVPCAPVRDLAEVNSDPHLWERGFFETVDHSALGSIGLPTSPIRFEGQPSGPLEPNPSLGRDTEDVVRDWLGGPVATERSTA